MILHRAEKCLGYETEGGAEHVFFRTGRGKQSWKCALTRPQHSFYPRPGAQRYDHSTVKAILVALLCKLLADPYRGAAAPRRLVP